MSGVPQVTNAYSGSAFLQYPHGTNAASGALNGQASLESIFPSGQGETPASASSSSIPGAGQILVPQAGAVPKAHSPSDESKPLVPNDFARNQNLAAGPSASHSITIHAPSTQAGTFHPTPGSSVSDGMGGPTQAYNRAGQPTTVAGNPGKQPKEDAGDWCEALAHCVCCICCCILQCAGDGD